MDNNLQTKENIEVPEWMKNEEVFKNKGINIDTGFIRKTLLAISKVIQEDFLFERNSYKSGLFQKLDARVKLISVIYLLIITGVASRFMTLLFLSTIAIALVKLSNLSLKQYFKRVWLIIPFIFFIISIPPASNLLIKGKPILYLYRNLNLKIWFFQLPNEIYFSMEGIKIILKISFRMGISISFGYLLIMTSKWADLSKSLNILKVSKFVISILDMSYRYIFVLSKTATQIFEARFLRMVGKVENNNNRNFVAKTIAFMFIKTSYMSEEIYNSMVSRGYTGEAVSLTEFRLTVYDFIWTMNLIIASLILFIGEMYFG